MRIFRYISIILVLLVLALYLRSSFADYQEFGGEIFNTYYHVKIRTPLPDRTLPAKVSQTLEEVNRQMSVFREDSEISRLNSAEAGIEFPLSAPLAYLLKSSATINRQSKGAFDPAIAPLIDLWGFGPSHELLPPADEELAEVLAYSNFKQLRFSSDFAGVTKADSRTSLNLSAIAKGYAVDKIAALLEETGFNDYIVEIGGEVKLSGTRDDEGNLWNIGIGAPQKDSSANALVLELSDIAAATSGDYRNYIEQDGQTFSHTISPLSGRPVKNELASVTVFAPSCMEADAYATAIMAAGKEQGLKLAEELKLPVIFFVHKPGGGFEMQSSTAAHQLIGSADETD